MKKARLHFLTALCFSLIPASVSNSQAEVIGARGNTVAVVIWPKQIAAARRDHKWLFEQKARKTGGQGHVAPSESELDSWWQVRGSFSGWPEAKLERAKSTELNFASQSVTTTYHHRV